MSEPFWLTSSIALDIHAEQLTLFGGPGGIRDEGMLESALARPQNKYAYGETSMAVLAAAYAYGLSKNHPFIDGNKRTSFACMMVFLRVNGVMFRPPVAEATAKMLDLAAGLEDEESIARWIEAAI